MKKRLCTLVFLIITSMSYAQQEFSVMLPNFKGQSLSAVKKNNNFSIIAEARGDLNYDHVDDIALVLETKDSIYEKRTSGNDEFTKGKARILLVFLHQKGKQIVHTQNNKFIARSYESNMGSYIEPALYIENNEFMISNVYIRATQSYTFQLQNTSFFIVNAVSSSVHASSFVNTEYDFKNRKVITTTGHICYGDEKVTSAKFYTKPKTLAEFNEMYEWEVLKNHFL